MILYIKNKNKLTIIVLSILSLSFLVSCIVSPDLEDEHRDNKYSASQEFSYNIDITTQSQLFLSAINGTIEISGVTEADSLKIWGEIRVNSDTKEDAENSLDNLSVVISETESRIAVETKQPSKTYGRNYQVFYHILIPQTWKVMVNSVNGPMYISAIQNEVKSTSTNGDCIIENVTGDVTTVLLNGSMHLWDLTGNLSSNLTNGNISSKIQLPDNGVCQLHTVNGEISLSIPTSTSADFSAQVQNGIISIKSLTIHTTTSSSKSVIGRIGNGEGNIELTAVNGNILVSGI
jgi:hypothetical protein